MPAPTSPLLRGTQRFTLVLNLLLVLVLVLGVTIVAVGARRGQHTGAPPADAPTTSPSTSSSPPSTVFSRTVIRLPPACIRSTELADEIISRLNRNSRDTQLALAPRDWTIASNECRRQAASGD